MACSWQYLKKTVLNSTGLHQGSNQETIQESGILKHPISDVSWLDQLDNRTWWVSFGKYCPTTQNIWRKHTTVMMEMTHYRWGLFVSTPSKRDFFFKCVKTSFFNLPNYQDTLPNDCKQNGQASCFWDCWLHQLILSTHCRGGGWNITRTAVETPSRCSLHIIAVV